MQELLSVQEAADALKISPRTLFTLTKKGAISAVKIGRRVLYSPADIATFIESCRTKLGAT